MKCTTDVCEFTDHLKTWSSRSEEVNSPVVVPGPPLHRTSYSSSTCVSEGKSGVDSRRITEGAHSEPVQHTGESSPFGEGHGTSVVRVYTSGPDRGTVTRVARSTLLFFCICATVLTKKFNLCRRKHRK